ncbi:mannose-binding lectin protein [Ralstonia solanacearum]|nr:mannose-binding lectin protein [Ralstonia solanacearum]MDC6212501.1 mannose-binding lectin protein [Ralstonia solanacearum]MDC6241369.1 mannose-binding lectin protein [Ralstonia solanacearum]MDD7803052.1 mannose-binding lectin protein [Ralstonia solanacearum]
MPLLAMPGAMSDASPIVTLAPRFLPHHNDVIGDTDMTQDNLAAPDAVQTLVRTVNISNGETWVAIQLPAQYRFFDLVFENVSPSTSGSVLVAQMAPQSGGVYGSNYSGSGWGNDLGGGGFYGYSDAKWMCLWPANRSGPNSKTGIYGTCKLMNLNQSNAVPSVISDLFAPTAYKSQPGYANVGGCCQKITGQASSIQFAFALAGGNVPQNTDTFSGGTIQVYGWN